MSIARRSPSRVPEMTVATLGQVAPPGMFGELQRGRRYLTCSSCTLPARGFRGVVCRRGEPPGVNPFGKSTVPRRCEGSSPRNARPGTLPFVPPFLRDKPVTQHGSLHPVVSPGPTPRRAPGPKRRSPNLAVPNRSDGDDRAEWFQVGSVTGVDFASSGALCTAATIDVAPGRPSRRALLSWSSGRTRRLPAAPIVLRRFAPVGPGRLKPVGFHVRDRPADRGLMEAANLGALVRAPGTRRRPRRPRPPELLDGGPALVDASRDAKSGAYSNVSTPARARHLARRWRQPRRTDLGPSARGSPRKCVCTTKKKKKKQKKKNPPKYFHEQHPRRRVCSRWRAAGVVLHGPGGAGTRRKDLHRRPRRRTPNTLYEFASPNWVPRGATSTIPWRSRAVLAVGRRRPPAWMVVTLVTVGRMTNPTTR